MPYRCRDIEIILSSQSDDCIEEAAFLAHLDSCSECRNRFELDEPIEDALKGLLPSPAPVEIFDRVTLAIADYGKRPGLGHMLLKIGYAISVMLLAITGVLAYTNRDMIYNGILSIKAVLNELVMSLKQLGLADQSVLSIMEKIVASPFLISGLAVLAAIIWSYSIKQIREISK
jgi:hypothetical protein